MLLSDVPPSEEKDAMVLANKTFVAEYLCSHARMDGSCVLFEPAYLKGYAEFTLLGKRLYGHRCSLLLSGAAKPKDSHYALHRCRNKNCINPDHLYWGTRKDNWHDAIRDGTAHVFVTRKGEEHPSSVLSTKQVVSAYEWFRTTSATVDEIAKHYGVNRSCIDSIVRRRSRVPETVGLPSIDLKKKNNENRRGTKCAIAKLTDEKSREIYLKYLQGLRSTRDIAKDYGVSNNTITAICSRRIWAHATCDLPEITREAKLLRFARGSDALTAQQAISIRRDYHAGDPPKTLVERYGVNRVTVSNVITNKTWRNAEKHLGLPQLEGPRSLPVCFACGVRPKSSSKNKRCQQCADNGYFGVAPTCRCGCGLNTTYEARRKRWRSYYPPHNPRRR